MTDVLSQLPARIREKISVDPSGCWLWTASTVNGYGVLRWRGKMAKAHRVVYELAHGPIPGHTSYHGMCVCHTCDTPDCVNPAHLFLGTNADNAADRDAKGRRRAPRGELHVSAKLTDDQVREIRALRGRASQRVIADRFGVSDVLVSKIQLRKVWTHVE